MASSPSTPKYPEISLRAFMASLSLAEKLPFAVMEFVPSDEEFEKEPVPSLLGLFVRPCVYFIQTVVDPEFRNTKDPLELSPTDKRGVEAGIDLCAQIMVRRMIPPRSKSPDGPDSAASPFAPRMSQWKSRTAPTT